MKDANAKKIVFRIFHIVGAYALFLILGTLFFPEFIAWLGQVFELLSFTGIQIPIIGILIFYVATGGRLSKEQRDSFMEGFRGKK